MSLIGILVWTLLAAGEPAEIGEPSPDVVRFFETAVRPVLVEHCQKCHGEAKQQAGLRLDSRKALLGGGDSGPAVVPGKPDESRLIRAVRQVDDDLKMPPKG